MEKNLSVTYKFSAEELYIEFCNVLKGAAMQHVVSYFGADSEEVKRTHLTLLAIDKILGAVAETDASVEFSILNKDLMGTVHND